MRSARLSQKNVVESSPCMSTIRWPVRCVLVTGKKDLGLWIMTGVTVAVILVSFWRVAAIVDLGTPDELRQRYGYEEAQGGGTGFASIHLRGDKVMILKQDLSAPEYQRLQEGPKLFTEVTPSATAPIKLGHIYLVRIADKKDPSYQQLVKLMVIAYRPEEAVTLRWELL